MVSGCKAWFLSKPVNPVPRTRGDGPDTRFSPSTSKTLFPAHAGLDRRYSQPDHDSPTVPRTRGDGPMTVVLCQNRG